MPTATIRTKYSNNVHAGYTVNGFKDHKLPTPIVLAIVSAANHSLSKNTWSSYKTAENHLQRCEADTGIKIRLPMDHKMLLAYIGWLLSKRKVQSNTISQYISGLRVAHMKAGFIPPCLRPDIVQAILKGQSNIDSMKAKEKAPRLTVTTSVLKLIKHLLRTSKFSIEKRRLTWTVCCLAFHGSFRIHELLSRSGKEYDPTQTLLGKDTSLKTMSIDGNEEEVLAITIKMPKEEKLPCGVTVELFRNDTFSCPINAFTKWRSVSKVSHSRIGPIFREEDGSCYTGRKFNADLKMMLSPYVDYSKRKILSHSFRAGMASMMATAGMTDSEIMIQGRWHSKAFLTYCKNGRSHRMRQQREVARRLCSGSK